MSYYTSLINENKSDPKVLFNTIDRMLHRKPQNHYPSCGSPKELRDKFADFFCDKIVTIRHQLDILSITDAPALPLIDDPIITCELSEFSPTSEDELSGLVKKIATKSCSLDPVPASLLRYCIDDLLPIIKRVVNLSFNSASVPSSMKNAVLSPLLKKPSPDFEIFSNFRPVSNLKFLSKVIEKTAATRLMNYLCDNDLNESLQSAYKEHHSCETALLRVQNDILKSIALFFCCWICQQHLTLLIIRSYYTDCDPGLVQKEKRFRGFSLILRIVPSQFRLMDLPLQLARSDLVYPRGPCWVRCCISCTRPHWVT